jgi:hypothetical protein
MGSQFCRKNIRIIFCKKFFSEFFGKTAVWFRLGSGEEERQRWFPNLTRNEKSLPGDGRQKRK